MSTGPTVAIANRRKTAALIFGATVGHSNDQTPMVQLPPSRPYDRGSKAQSEVNPGLQSTEAAAKYLGVTRTTVYRLGTRQAHHCTTGRSEPVVWRDTRATQKATRCKPKYQRQAARVTVPNADPVGGIES
jgi:hypothetical protein